MTALSARTFQKASVATALSVAASFTVCNIIVPLLGGTFDGTGLWMSIICPLFIAFPVSLWQFHQSEKHRTALAQVSDMHRQLDEMHQVLRTTHAALEHKYLFDTMTGALTREAFFSRLRSASTSGQTGALLLADADHFKRINDEHGHGAGDAALVAIGAAIQAALRSGDFWGRIGGEEFAIFLPEAPSHVATVIAETIRLNVASSPFDADGSPANVTISLGGVALQSYFDPNVALNEADRRLYRAKHAGRDRVVFSAEQKADAA